MIEEKIVRSWAMIDGNVNSTSSLLTWINNLNNTTYVDIRECSINESDFWFFDDFNGEILNKKRSFFSIKGIRRFINNNFTNEQPIILQPEIGYLGIICKEIDGVLNFLMQAKIEPGNVNCVQISPTIQATKSNFTRVHGGNFPPYLTYFEHANKYRIIYDQIQSEQATRFYKKRNRNMILLIEEDIDILPNFRWMTLGQIKELMKIKNLVNMDTRTVISGIPLFSCQDNNDLNCYFKDKSLFKSIFKSDLSLQIPQIYQKINDYKMFKDVYTSIISLNELTDWSIDEYGIISKRKADFMVRFYDITISGREVQHWTQPLFKANGIAIFGLLTCIDEGKRQYLIRIKPEIGSFDKIELGPTIQWEPTHNKCKDDSVEVFFRNEIANNNNIIKDVMLSEEGGRFYHEQNRNIIMECNKSELNNLPNYYIWVDFATLNFLVQINNCLNIQLRNLISLISIQ